MPSVGRWMENFAVPHMPIFGCFRYINVSFYRTFITRRVHGRFYLKGIVVNDEEIDCRLNEQRNLDLNETCVVSSCRERMLEFYSD